MDRPPSKKKAKSLRERLKRKVRRVSSRPDEWTMLERILNAHLCYGVGLDEGNLLFINYCHEQMTAEKPLTELEIKLLGDMFQRVLTELGAD